MRDCLFALQGIDSDTMGFDCSIARFALKPTVSIGMGAQLLVAEVLTMASHHRHIQAVLALENESLVFQAFRGCVRKLLLDYFKWISGGTRLCASLSRDEDDSLLGANPH